MLNKLRALPVAFSVVIPTHGGRESLIDTVQSVLGQSYPNFEVLVVSDGEPLQTARLLAGIDDARVRLIAQDKLGGAHARNHGLAQATNDWVAFLDDDDQARSNWLSSFASLITNETLAATGSVCVWQGDASAKRQCALSLDDPTMGASTVLAGGFCVRRDLLMEIGGYDTSLKAAQNQDLGLRLCDHILAAGVPGEIAVTSEVLVDVIVEAAGTRDARYGASRRDAAEVFLARYAERLEKDAVHHADLLRIISRSDRMQGRTHNARAASLRACRLDWTNPHNYRSLILAVFVPIGRYLRHYDWRG